MSCSANPYSRRSADRAAPNPSARPSSSESNTANDVCPGPSAKSSDAAVPGSTRGWASRAGPRRADATAAACAAETTAATDPADAASEAEPATVAAAPSTAATTNHDRSTVTPLVVTVLLAHRMFAELELLTTTTHPSATLAANAASTICCGVSRPTGSTVADAVMPPPPGSPRRLGNPTRGAGNCADDSLGKPRSRRLPRRVENVHAAEPGSWAAVRDRGHLAGLTLAAVEGAAQPVGLWTADTVHRPPEVGGGGLVGHVADLPGQPAAADPVEPLPGELEVVPLHVDRPRLVADHVDAVLHPGDQVLRGAAGRVGLQADVGHSLDGDVRGRVGVRAPVRARQTQPARERAVQLIADQDAAPDQIPGLPGDPVVVESDGGQPVRHHPVAGDVHPGRPVGQPAQLVGRGERGSGIGGLVSDGPVVLGGVTDRLVDVSHRFVGSTTRS